MDHTAGVALAMPKGGGGGDSGIGGDGAGMVSVAQLRRLLGLQGGGAQGGGGGGKGAYDRRPRERRDRRQQRAAAGGEGGGVERREGDWQCGSCSFSPNFAWKARCFRCGAPKPRDSRAATDRASAARTSGASVGKGPVGAGGSRPLLSSFASRAAAAAAGLPSYRPLGTSAAARAMARPMESPTAAGEAARRQGPRQQPQPRCAQQQWQQGIDDTQSAAHAASSVVKGGGHPGVAAAPPSSAFGGKGRPRWADEDPPCDRVNEDDEDIYMDADVADADADDLGEEDADEEGYEEATPEQLRQTWLAECRAVKSLEAQGRHAGSAALAAARDARDEAEASWRRAVGPAPVAVRMGRAQQRLDRAAKTLERCRLDLEEFEDEMDKQRSALRQRIDDAEERYRARAVQLDELHAEAGELATGSTTAYPTRRAESEVCNMVAADLQALVETLPEDSDARGSVNLILAKMACAASSAGPQRYDIGDAGAGEEDGARAGGRWAGGESAEGAHWSEDSNGRWSRRAAAAAREKGSDGAEGGWQLPRRPIRITGNKEQVHGSSSTGAASSGWNVTVSDGGAGTADAGNGNDGGKPAAGSRGASGVEGGPSATAATAAAIDAGASRKGGEQIGQRRKREGDEDADTLNKSHRGEDIVREASVELGGDDAARAEKLQKEQAIAIWAARNAQSIFGDNASRAIAGQLYAHKVQLVQQRAREVGVDPKAEDGRDLLGLEPEEFTRWTQTVLEPAEKKASGDKDL